MAISSNEYAWRTKNKKPFLLVFLSLNRTLTLRVEGSSAQIFRYADSDIVRESVKTTTLHKLVVIYRGTEMVECREV